MATNSQFVLTGNYIRTSDSVFEGPNGYRFTRQADGQAFVPNLFQVEFDDSSLQKIDCFFMDKSDLGGSKYARYRSSQLEYFAPSELPHSIIVSKSGPGTDFSSQTFTKMAKNADWMSHFDLDHRPDNGGYEATINGVNYFLLPKEQVFNVTVSGATAGTRSFYDGGYKKSPTVFNGKTAWFKPTTLNTIAYEPTINNGSWIIFDGLVDITTPIDEGAVLFKSGRNLELSGSSADNPPLTGWSRSTLASGLGLTLQDFTTDASNVTDLKWILYSDKDQSNTFVAEDLDFGGGIIPITTSGTYEGGTTTFTINQIPRKGYIHIYKDNDLGGVPHWLVSFKETSTLSGVNIYQRAITSNTVTPNLSSDLSDLLENQSRGRIYHPFVQVPDNSLYSNTSHNQDELVNYFWRVADTSKKFISFGQYTWLFSNTEGDPLEMESRPFTDFGSITPTNAVWSGTSLSSTPVGYTTDPGQVTQRSLYFSQNSNFTDEDLVQTHTAQSSSYRLSGLIEGNRYYWRVDLTNAGGISQGETFYFNTSSVVISGYDEVESYSTSSYADTTSGDTQSDEPYGTSGFYGDDVGRLVGTAPIAFDGAPLGYIEDFTLSYITSGYIGGERFELERLVSGEKSKIFKTSKGVMVGAIEEDYNNFEVTSGNNFNKFSSYASDMQVLVKNLYFSDEFQRQSHVNVPITEDTDGLLNVISPDVSQLSVTQFNETAVGMTDLTDKTIKYLNYDANKFSEDLLEGRNAIAVYTPSGSINESKSSVPSSSLEPTFIITGLDFNFIEETPVEFEFQDFNSGILYSNVMNAKNMYNSKFNTNVVTSGDTFATKTNFLTGDTNLIGSLSAEVHDTRYYIDVNSDSNHLLYNVYRIAKSYEPNADVHSTAKLLKPFNSDPYFRSWNVQNTALTGWVTSGDSQTDSNRRLSAFVEEFRIQNKATADSKRKRANQFNLFSSVVMSGKSKVQTNGEILKPNQTYTFRVELDTQHLSGNGTSFFRSNGSKIISAPGVTEWQYQVSTTDPNSSHLFLSGDHNDSQCILKSLSVAKGNRSLVSVRNKGIKNNNFSSWNHTDDSADNYYSTPTNWVVSATSGIVERDEKALPNFNEVRSCITMAKSGFVQISNTNNTFNNLSAADKTYALLVKFPDHLPQTEEASGSHTPRTSDDERMCLIGKPDSFTEGEDHICIFPPGKRIVNHSVDRNPKVWWRGGSSAVGAGNIFDADQSFKIDHREFNGQWKWLVFRKDRANTKKKFAMTNTISAMKSEVNNDTDIDLNTFNPGIGASVISPYMAGRSSLSFSRYYEWNRSLTDGETEGIIKLNHIPSGALVGYKFENPNTEKIINTLSANARDGDLIRLEDTNGNKEEMDTFWSDNMKLKRPDGGVRMYNNGTGFTALEQAGAFISPSGFYDVSLTTSDFASGTVSLFCGLSSIGITNEPGTKRFKFNKVGTNAPSALIIKLEAEGTSSPISGFGDVVINSVDVTCLSGNAGTGDVGNNASLYDLAERVEGFYRYQTLPVHKSNLFSIRINNSRLNKDQTLGEVEKEKIKKSVTNVVKNIVDKITPVHTQLLGIDFTGE